jgi:hypothetical protein
MTKKMKSKKVRASCTQKECDELRQRIFDASVLMWDFDGYYDPNTKRGDIEGLAEIIQSAYMILQGQMWENNTYDSHD